MTLAELNDLDDAAFAEALSGIYESSPWVPERAAVGRPFADLEALKAGLRRVVDTAGLEAQHELIKAHPDLVARKHRKAELTDHSKKEQSGAGLDALADDEADELLQLNKEYRDKFDFPFIQCVRKAGPDQALPALRARLQNDADAELRQALEEIHWIASYRLDDLIKE